MYKLTFVTPEKRVVVAEEIEQVTVPALKGELNIHPGHAPLITTLETGVISWKLKNKDDISKAIISGGYCQVSTDGVSVLAEYVDMPNDISNAEAVEMAQKINVKMATEHLSDEAYAKAISDIKRFTSVKQIQ